MDAKVQYEGPLEKESGAFKKKSSVWVVLDTADLSFYRQEKRSSCIGSVKISDILTVRKTEKENGCQFELQTEAQSFLFNASSAELAETWITVIQQCISNNSLKKDKASELKVTTSARSSKDFSENDTSAIPDLSSSTFFGVRLKSSRKSPASPNETDMFSFKPPQEPKKIEAITMQTVELKADLNKLLNVKTGSPEGPKDEPKTDIAQQKRAQGPPPPPPERVESLKDTTESQSKDGVNRNLPSIPIPKKKSPPSFKPPPPPVRTATLDKPGTEAANSGGDKVTIKPEVAHGMTTFLPTKKSEIVAGEQTKSTLSVSDNTTDNANKEASVMTPVTNGIQPPGMTDHAAHESKPNDAQTTQNAENVVDTTTGNVNEEPSVIPPVTNGPQPSGMSDHAAHESKTNDTHTKQNAENIKDVELRNKPDYSDVDTSHVEMRRSRRSTRNGSTNQSWTTSQKSIDLESSKPEVPTITLDAVEDTSEELSDLEKILGNLLAGKPNCFHDEDQTTDDIPLESDAFVRLKTYFEENSEYPFDLSIHKITMSNSVQLLRNYLSV